MALNRSSHFYFNDEALLLTPQLPLICLRPKTTRNGPLFEKGRAARHPNSLRGGARLDSPRQMSRIITRQCNFNYKYNNRIDFQAICSCKYILLNVFTLPIRNLSFLEPDRAVLLFYNVRRPYTQVKLLINTINNRHYFDIYIIKQFASSIRINKQSALFSSAFNCLSNLLSFFEANRRTRTRARGNNSSTNTSLKGP